MTEQPCNETRHFSKLASGYEAFSDYIQSLLDSPAVPLRVAAPPEQPGVYALIYNQEIVYIGSANGSSGLRDRLLNKHISGDDNHAIQRALKADFPVRLHRREHIKDSISAKWVAIEDSPAVAVVERLLIWLITPPWNRT